MPPVGFSTSMGWITLEQDAGGRQEEAGTVAKRVVRRIWGTVEFGWSIRERKLMTQPDWNLSQNVRARERRDRRIRWAIYGCALGIVAAIALLLWGSSRLIAIRQVDVDKGRTVSEEHKP